MSTGGIDIHAHIVPPAFLNTLAAKAAAWGIGIAGDRFSLPGGITSNPIAPLLLDVDEKLRRMDGAGVEREVLSPFVDLSAGFAGASAPEYARALNESIAEIVATHPDRFSGLATLPTADADAAAIELERAVADLGMSGAQLPAVEVAERDLEAVWRVADSRRALVFLHPLASTTSTATNYVGNYAGNPSESTHAAGRLLTDGVLERFERMAVVLPHGGGFLPYQVGRFQHGYETHGGGHGARWARAPRDMVRRFYFDTVLHDPVALRFLIDSVGVDRVVLGTDDPFDMAVELPIHHIETVPGLETTEREQIAFGTLSRLLQQVE